MKFWDSSALMPRFFEEATTALVKYWIDEDPEIIVWMMTRVELCSAIARRSRGHAGSASIWNRLLQDVMRSWPLWQEITDARTVRIRSEEVLRRHALRAADALQLGAAIVAADGDLPSLEFVTFDKRLAEAARREGFRVRGAST